MKYLITQEQVTRLQELADAFELVSIQGLIDELKPIEPLTDEAIADAMLEPVCGLTEYDREFARAIEERILGDKHDSDYEYC